MRKLLVPVAALLLSDALLRIGHGLQFTLLPLRASLEGFTDTEVALTGSAYFAGFVAGCLLAPRTVRRVGHIRSFAVLSSAFSALLLVFPMLPGFLAWLLLRALTGLCISGLYMIIERWLNERATRESRGTILSAYTVINLTAIIAGQQLVNLAAPSSAILFALGAILLSLAVIPVSLTTALAPAPIARVRIDLKEVWTVSHVGLGGAAALGFVTGAFWSLAPAKGRDVGLDVRGVTLLMSAAPRSSSSPWAASRTTTTAGWWCSAGRCSVRSPPPSSRASTPATAGGSPPRPSSGAAPCSRSTPSARRTRTTGPGRNRS